MWTHGTLVIPTSTGDVECQYSMKRYERPSGFGIDGGRISKLEMYVHDELVLHYDREWDICPKDNTVVMWAFFALLQWFN